MKFKMGHWLTKPEINPLYAVEVCRAEQAGDDLHLLAATQHIAHRGDTLEPVLTARVFSPAEGVIGVEVYRHKGAPKAYPAFEINRTGETPAIAIGGETAMLTAGALSAEVSLKPNDWRIAFSDENGQLTESGARMTGHMANRDTGKNYMMQQLSLSVGECVYGLGERFTAFVKNGQVVDMWNGDGGSCSELAYKNIPFYLTNRGYGVLVDSPSDVSFEVASEQVERVQFSCEGERLTYYIIAGPTPRDVLGRYTRLTGRPALPPAWSFGLWLSTSFTTDYDEKTATHFIDGMRERGIPLDVFHFDCFWMRGYNWCDFEWDRQMFPDPEGMLQRYREKGLKICVWINPYIGQASPLFDEGMENGYLIQREDGSVWQSDLWQSGMGIVDFTNPAAREWYRAYLRKLLKMGVDCFKTDFGERIPVRGVKYFDGSDPVRMHNYYSYLYNEAVFSLLIEERGEGEAVLFARSATAGGQKFPVHWGGDNFATYISMAETLRAGLSLASCGFGYWSHDISGFEQTAPADVYKRWCQFGLLSSHSRLHGSQSYRVPWLFDEESSEVLKKFTRLKCRLMPYIYQMAVIAHREGIPVMRPMFMEFSDDPACDTLDRQYMLGESLLVAPVFREDGQVDYYLPAGKWTHLLDGRTVAGGRWMRETYDFMSLPLWVRENTLLPIGAVEETAAYDFAAGVELRAYHVTRPVEIEIPDAKGVCALRARAEYKGGKLVIETEGSHDYSWIDIRED
ncbi:MAG: alpha-xylosidase [Christensenellales bacterium]|jgi:alpha-D-xyloside xylohydrolase